MDEGTKLRGLTKRVRDWTPVLHAAGSLLVGSIQRSFTAQKRGTVKWPPRAVPNVAGILSDLAAGRGVPSRRFEARPAAVDTGRLKGSITYRIRGRDEVRVGTNVPHAGKVQNGGTTTIRITPEVRNALARLLRRNKGLRDRMGYLLNPKVKKYETETQARPFVTVEPQDEAAIKKLVAKHASGA